MIDECTNGFINDNYEFGGAANSSRVFNFAAILLPNHRQIFHFFFPPTPETKSILRPCRRATDTAACRNLSSVCHMFTQRETCLFLCFAHLFMGAVRCATFVPSTEHNSTWTMIFFAISMAQFYCHFLLNVLQRKAIQRRKRGQGKCRWIHSWRNWW